MKNEHIKIISMNSHFYALIIQTFLTGYKKDCSLEMLYNVLPFITYIDLRTPLINANSKSSLYSVYSDSKNHLGKNRLSSKVRKIDFRRRYYTLKPYLGKALIVLYSNKKIILIKNRIKLLEEVKYQKYDIELRNWLKASYYLGSIFNKISIKELKYFLEERTL